MNSGSSILAALPQNNSLISNPAGPFVPNMSGSIINPAQFPRPSIATKFRPDGTWYRPITPLEALYYHERLDLITHPLIKGN